MFTINDDLSIHATRGDTVFFTVTAEENGTPYFFEAGDVLRMKIYGKKNAQDVVLEKCFPVTARTDRFTILLTEEDTKIGDVISKPKDYWYEIELNPFTNPQTIIGYDEDGAKVFKLFPEGKDSEEPEVNPEDIPVVDIELDMTSNRPVENRAIARAIVNIAVACKVTEKEVKEKTDKTEASLVKIGADIGVERARIDNLVSGATADGAEVVDIRVGANGKMYASAGSAVRKQLNDKLNKNFTNISSLVGLTHEVGCYRNAQGSSIFTVVNDKLTTVKVANVQAGERYFLNTYMSLGELYYNFFVFETAVEGVAAVSANDIEKYVEFIDDTEYGYIFTIPDGCVTFYSAVTAGRESEAKIWKLEEFDIPMLRLNKENFTEKCIPLSALDFETEDYDDVRSNTYECIEKPFDFKNKTLIAFGDSITVGVTSHDLAVSNNSYIKLFANKFNMTLTNLAESGSTLAYSEESTLRCITDKVCSRKTDNPDFVFVAGGINDYSQGRKVGVFGDTEKTTVYGALNLICEHFKSYFANSTIIFITPVNITKTFATSVASLDTYRKAIFEVATSYGFNVVDGFSIGLPSTPGGWGNVMIGDEDGVHPSEKGHELYFKGLCNKLC